MAILYQTAKFESANILVMAILGSTAKFHSRQYIWLYSTIPLLSSVYMTVHVHVNVHIEYIAWYILMFDATYYKLLYCL